MVAETLAGLRGSAPELGGTVSDGMRAIRDGTPLLPLESSVTTKHIKDSTAGTVVGAPFLRRGPDKVGPPEPLDPHSLALDLPGEGDSGDPFGLLVQDKSLSAPDLVGVVSNNVSKYGNNKCFEQG